jgi:hypothetical protein
MAQSLKVKRQIIVHQTLNFDPELTGEESLLARHAVRHVAWRSTFQDGRNASIC